jgi:hypothetical protein
LYICSYSVNIINPGSINTNSFEFDYMILTIKYLFFYYIFMGLMPLLFEKLKLNNNKVKQRPPHPSKSSKFVDRPSYKSIYTKSIIVNDITPKTMGENFTFIDKNELYYDNN